MPTHGKTTMSLEEVNREILKIVEERGYRSETKGLIEMIDPENRAKFLRFLKKEPAPHELTVEMMARDD